MSKVLVAGLGNIFLGDDGFGVELAQRLQRRPLPDHVQVVDFGIRGIDLAYALLDDFALAILVDTAQRGGAPGSLYLIEPEADSTPPAPAAGDALFEGAHDLDPAQMLRMVRLLGGGCRRILLLACEPESWGTESREQGRIGLSATVAAAVEPAIALVERLLSEVRQAPAQTAQGG